MVKFSQFEADAISASVQLQRFATEFAAAIECARPPRADRHVAQSRWVPPLPDGCPVPFQPPFLAASRRRQPQRVRMADWIADQARVGSPAAEFPRVAKVLELVAFALVR